MPYKPKVGDIVTLTIIKKAYGSNYGLRPVVIVVPGMVGVVAATNVPCVYLSKRRPDTFNCVDFLHPVTGKVERVSAYDSQLRQFEPYTDQNMSNTPLVAGLTDINWMALNLDNYGHKQAYFTKTPGEAMYTLYYQRFGKVWVKGDYTDRAEAIKDGKMWVFDQ